MKRYPLAAGPAAAAFAALLLIAGVEVAAQTQQQHVHDMSHGVMPFDAAKTLHVFRMTEAGGVERVIVRDPGNADQIPLVRQHLRKEAERFQHGDYGDPATLHGAGMPGLAELERGARRIKVSYADRPDGGEITFSTTDRHLLTSIHRWFGAQLSEHGADAKAE